MITFFPQLLAYPGIAALILRIVSGVTLAYFGYVKIRGQGQSSGSNSKIYGIVELFLATLLVIGFYTQTVVLLNIFILIIKIAIKAKEGKLLTDGINYYILLLAMAVSLLFLGPGYMSIDSLIITRPVNNAQLSEPEARVIAEKSCIKGGGALSSGIYNENSKTWWYDANLNATKPGCNPACVVDASTKTAEINWRCTGLIEPE